MLYIYKTTVIQFHVVLCIFSWFKIIIKMYKREFTFQYVMKSRREIDIEFSWRYTHTVLCLLFISIRPNCHVIPRVKLHMIFFFLREKIFFTP